MQPPSSFHGTPPGADHVRVQDIALGALTTAERAPLVPKEIRDLLLHSTKYKSVACRNVARNSRCLAGAHCVFYHSPSEIRAPLDWETIGWTLECINDEYAAALCHLGSLTNAHHLQLVERGVYRTPASDKKWCASPTIPRRGTVIRRSYLNMASRARCTGGTARLSSVGWPTSRRIPRAITSLPASIASTEVNRRRRTHELVTDIHGASDQVARRDGLQSCA